MKIVARVDIAHDVSSCRPMTIASRTLDEDLTGAA
jgi:hypothetical protein